MRSVPYVLKINSKPLLPHHVSPWSPYFAVPHGRAHSAFLPFILVWPCSNSPFSTCRNCSWWAHKWLTKSNGHCKMPFLLDLSAAFGPIDNSSWNIPLKTLSVLPLLPWSVLSKPCWWPLSLREMCPRLVVGTPPTASSPLLSSLFLSPSLHSLFWSNFILSHDLNATTRWRVPIYICGQLSFF